MVPHRLTLSFLSSLTALLLTEMPFCLSSYRFFKEQLKSFQLPENSVDPSLISSLSEMLLYVYPELRSSEFNLTLGQEGSNIPLNLTKLLTGFFLSKEGSLPPFM